LCDQIKLDIPDIIFTKNLNDIEGEAGENLNLLAVLDDMLLSYMQSPKLIQRFFLQTTHHKSCSLFFLTQNLSFEKGRLVNINVDYIILIKWSRDCNMIKRFTKQANEDHADELVKSYREVTDNGKYKHFLVSFHANECDKTRYRSLVFPNDDLVPYVFE